MRKLLIVVILIILIPLSVEARSGCCSHHGGVCGCGCCDGTGLSATCAPYYPQCNKINCPANSTYKNGSCNCNTGYQSNSNGSACIKKEAPKTTVKKVINKSINFKVIDIKETDGHYKLTITTGNNATCIWRYQAGTGKIPSLDTTNTKVSQVHTIAVPFNVSGLSVYCFDDIGNNYTGILSK